MSENNHLAAIAIALWVSLIFFVCGLVAGYSIPRDEPINIWIDPIGTVTLQGDAKFEALKILERNFDDDFSDDHCENPFISF